MTWGFATKAENSPDPRVYKLCSGSTFTLTKYHILRRRIIEVTLPPIDPTIYIPTPHASPFAPAPVPDESE